MTYNPNYLDNQLTIAVSGAIDIKLLPHLLPVKFGNAFLLQYILNERGVGDDLHLLPLGFVVGVISLIVVLHSSAMGYLFRSFPVLCNYDPTKVDRVRLLAQWINNSLCVAQVVLVTFIWSYCVWNYNTVVYTEEEKDVNKNFVKRRIFEFSLVISSILFVCSIIAVTAVSFLYCVHKKQKKRQGYKSDFHQQLPPPANNLINLGLANTLLGQYIGIDDKEVGQFVLLQDFSMYVGSITIFMTILDTIISLSLYVAMMDGQLDISEVNVIKIIHIIR